MNHISQKCLVFVELTLVLNNRELEQTSLSETHSEVLRENADPNDNPRQDLLPEIPDYLADPGNPHSARITALTAIGMIHRYVQSLPSDKFTQLDPYWHTMKINYDPGALLLSGLGKGKQFITNNQDKLRTGLGK